MSLIYGVLAQQRKSTRFLEKQLSLLKNISDTWARHIHHSFVNSSLDNLTFEATPDVFDSSSKQCSLIPAFFFDIF